jgi:hypothetical protein
MNCILAIQRNANRCVGYKTKYTLTESKLNQSTALTIQGFKPKRCAVSAPLDQVPKRRTLKQNKFHFRWR